MTVILQSLGKPWHDYSAAGKLRMSDPFANLKDLPMPHAWYWC